MMKKRLLMGLAVGALLMALLPGVASAKAGDTSVCKDGGWTGLVRADGTAFKNQGDCVSYIAKGGTLQPPTRHLRHRLLEP